MERSVFVLPYVYERQPIKSPGMIHSDALKFSFGIERSDHAHGRMRGVPSPKQSAKALTVIEKLGQATTRRLVAATKLGGEHSGQKAPTMVPVETPLSVKRPRSSAVFQFSAAFKFGPRQPTSRKSA